MGLDMYLSKRIYVGAEYGHRNIKGKIEITMGEDNKPIKVNFKKVDSIIENAAYWRKANAIHQWFVENVQEGEDDCKEYYVGVDKLKDLVHICKRIAEIAVIENGKIINAEIIDDLLPTQEGFFFGSTDYDEDYIQDIKDTISQLEPLLEDETGDYYYQSSW